MIGQTKSGAEVVKVVDTGVYAVRCACGNLFTKTEGALKNIMRKPYAKLRCSVCYSTEARERSLSNGTIIPKRGSYGADTTSRP